MAKVELLVDDLRIAQRDIDIELMDSALISGVRNKIRAHLTAASNTILRIRMDDSKYAKFADLEGLEDLKVIRISGRSELVRKLGKTIPQWCTNEIIAELSLLSTPLPADSEDNIVDLQILELVNPSFSKGQSIEDLLFSIRMSPVPIGALLVSDQIGNHFANVMGKSLSTQQTSLIFQYIKSENFVLQLDGLFREIFFELVRQFLVRSKIQMPVPPREFPIEITGKLSLTREWWNTIDVDNQICSLTNRVLQEIEKKYLECESLAQIVWIYSTPQFEILAKALRSEPKLASRTLLESLVTLDSTEASALIGLVSDLISVPPPPALEKNSSAKQAIEWSKQYLNYARSKFRRGEEPDENISSSFSDWVIEQPTRVLNSDFNWRESAVAVKSSLSNGNLVVLLVVDALGSIVSDKLVDRLNARAKNFSIEERILFAPTPTLTEVGKIAVTVGIDANKVSSDALTAIQHIYKPLMNNGCEVKFAKGWKIGEQFFGQNTDLLVFYENQLDEQLHDCLQYSDFSNQLDLVCDKVCTYIDQWLQESESRQRPIEIFITADHGLTYIKDFSALPHTIAGQVKERCVKLSKGGQDLLEEFYQLRPEGAPNVEFWIPKGRRRLVKSDHHFVHGGLTPEEVLIPLLSIRPSVKKAIERINLKRVTEDAALTQDGWLLKLKVSAGDQQLENVVVTADYPFSGETKVPFIIANESLELMFVISSKVPQSGLVKMSFTVKYVVYQETSFSTSNTSIDINLRPQLLVRDQDADDFDKMFDI